LLGAEIETVLINQLAKQGATEVETSAAGEEVQAVLNGVTNGALREEVEVF